jgi:type IV secretory pathway TraG/TraD family ATPase VirD4
MSKLDEKEGMSLQFTIRSSRPQWHARARKVADDVQRGKSVKESLNSNWLAKFMSFFSNFIVVKKKENTINHEQQNRPTAMQEEMLKGIEEKNSKAGLDVNVRVVVSAANYGQAYNYLDNLAGAFSQMNYYEYGNSFNNKIKAKHVKKVINDFIYRRFDERHSFVLNTEELATLFHFPTRTVETPNVLWLTARHAPAPSDLSDEGIIIGKNVYRDVVKNIHFKRADRRRHTYVIGKSGVGKSKFIAGMAIQDIMNGEGVCVLDPHGDLIADIASRVPPERAEDVIVFSPSDFERPLALNLLEFDDRYPEQKTFVINEMIKIFDKLYDLKSTGGPIFEQYMRNAMLLIMSDPESGSTLMEIPKVLADPEFRKMKLARCKDQTVVDFWRKEAEKAGGDAALANVVPYITSKLTQFISNDTMRPIIGQQKSSFNLRDVMDKQKILLIDLSKGAIGELNAHLLGMIIIGKILMSALSRTDMSEENRKDFYLYIDEFQNFTTDSICSILSEARKYGLNLIIAHQYLGQLSEKGDNAIRDAVFGNVGTWVLFKVGSDDAEALEKEFSPVFNQYDLINVEKYTAYVKLLVDNTATRPFSVASPWPLPGIEREAMFQKIKALSRLKYGQDRRIIEAEIRRRTAGL